MKNNYLLLIVELLLICVFINLNNIAQAKQVLLYDPVKDGIELLDKNTYNNTVLNSAKATALELFAHWCGTCQRFASHWKEIAKDVKAWNNVIRVAALDCALAENEEICKTNKVEFYPTFVFFPPYHENRTGHKYEGELPTNYKIMEEMVKFVEKYKAPGWPDLTPLKTTNLTQLFDHYPKIKYSLIVFEKEDSYVGRKIILDFSRYSDRLLIHYTTSTHNRELFDKFDVSYQTQPIIYIVRNTKHSSSDHKQFEKLDDFLKHSEKLVEQNQIDEEVNHDKDDANHPTEHKDDLRYILGKTVREFIRFNKLITDEQLERLGETIDEGQKHGAVEKKKIGAQLNSETNYHVNMIDLESGLNYMFRHEVARLEVIKGEHLTVLKRWVSVLVKYFPGRKPVHNFLVMLNKRLNAVNDQLTYEEWEKIVSLDTPQAYLPNKVEWRHCKGSESRYRGYPCSLWTLFHTLTVSHVEMEKQKETPFENFNSSEVIEAVHDYIKLYFGCIECGKNFMKETDGYESYLKKPYDEVFYLWKVHNSVNKRLHGDPTEDPLHPKIQFPSKDKCPKCYKNDDEISTDGVISYLTSFYSWKQIEGIPELDAVRQDHEEKKAKEQEIKQTDKIELQNQIDEPMTNDKKVKLDEKVQNQIDLPVVTDGIKEETTTKKRKHHRGKGHHANKEMMKNSEEENRDVAQEDPIEAKLHVDKKLEGDKLVHINRIDYDSRDAYETRTRGLDYFLSFIVYSLVLLTFCCLYFYFKMLRRRAKVKKHII